MDFDRSLVHLNSGEISNIETVLKNFYKLFNEKGDKHKNWSKYMKYQINKLIRENIDYLSNVKKKWEKKFVN